ncbi:phospholipase D-like domain-containing protein [Tistrella bauzanensis]|uniref:Phospholipase D n=2 Tax=Geminicoccaceae TaxID=2066434 RepID=A0ABU9YNX8_9PROT
MTAISDGVDNHKMADMADASPETALLDVGRNCWRVERADRFALIIDADDYFTAARLAMMSARRSILLIGWDFDARIKLGPTATDGPVTLGDFILWLARRTPGLEIRLLRWDTGAFKALFRGDTIYSLLRWKIHPRITLKLDGAHPFASSHHQKIVVIDDRLAFCGGIDMTGDRWDRRAHDDHDPNRLGPDGRPRGPWHDATSVLDGPAAAALAELARDRWLAATGEILQPVSDGVDCWPAPMQPGFRNVDIAIARTRPKMEGVEPQHEIEALYLDLIARARHLIYAESQYFASRRVARAIAARLVEDDGPEIIIINPVTADGWLEPVAMDTARARLIEALRRIDRHGRLKVYHPHTRGGAPIYVHAKITIVDNHYLRIGSSNFNNRSMRLDTECDVVIDTDLPANAGLQASIADIRNDLLAEHLGTTPEVVAARHDALGSMIATIEDLRGDGRSLRPYELPELSATEIWLADNEILDPEGPDAIFEPLHKRGLFRNWHLPRRLRRRRVR